MKHNRTVQLCVVTMLTLAICLAGCGPQQSVAQGEDLEAIPEKGCEFYGISYAMPQTDWTYMFNASELGNGEEMIDLEMSSRETEKGLEAYWKEACESEEYCEDRYVLKDSGKTTIDGRDCYWYDKFEDGHGEMVSYWRKALLLPQNDGNRYIKIESDFIEQADKRKADKFFRKLLKSVRFVDSEAYVVNDEYLCLGGAWIPAEGLEPVQLFYGLMDLQTTGGLVSAQIGFQREGYQKGVDALFEEMEWYDDCPLRDDGTIEIDGVRGKWYTWVDSLPDSMTHLSYCVMIPVEDMQGIVTVNYNFNGDVEDLSQYDEQIKALTDQLHFTKAM